MPVAVEEFLGALGSVVELSAPATGEQSAAPASADQVARVRSQERADDGEGQYLGQREVDGAVPARHAEQARGEQEGIAGQEEADQEAGLGEEDDGDAERAECGQQGSGVEQVHGLWHCREGGWGHGGRLSLR